MRQTTSFLLARSVLGVALAVFGPADAAQGQGQAKKPAATTSRPSAEGRQAFASHCAACHGLGGRGGEHAPDIVANPRVKGFSDQTLSQIIRDGIPRRGMPAFSPSLTRSQIQEVVAYIRSVGGRQVYSRVSGNSSRGKALFFGKAGCNDCHMISGSGGFLGPDLSDYGRDHSPLAIREAIVKPEKFRSPDRQIVTVLTRDGQHLSGVALSEDNFSLQLRGLNGNFYLLMKSELAEVKREPRSLMPGDYATRLSRTELDDLTGYLASMGR